MQHLSGTLPLILGEYGIDSIREGEEAQARHLVQHVERVYRHGLAGSYVFSYTDDWYTGGQQIEDWEFGLVRRDRTEKPAAPAMRDAWDNAVATLSLGDLPSVSVVVCSYNGSRTLEECLESLMRLTYADYEVILVDDGSTDATAEIAERFPLVRLIRQENRGLSAARNVGARAAKGAIIAYTDDDCVADPDWLTYLVRAMLDQDVVAIGGPNITPATDGWVARCVAASPGNPSHVMLDDRHAEHVPGCNMAVRRDVLLDMGGFDTQFRQAGDDVDVCWRLLDQGYSIGFAPAAVVWHHRRCTVRDYLKQQRGYGRSEGLVSFKHPKRFGQYGRPSFRGVIYGDGAVGLPVLPPRIYHGRFGSAPFQTIYRQQVYGLWSWVTSLEWHVLALFLVLMGLLYPVFCGVAAAMWTATLVVACDSAIRAPLPMGAPAWCRPLVAWLYLAQPVVRGWHRYVTRTFRRRLPQLADWPPLPTPITKRVSSFVRDHYWENLTGQGREQLLEALEQEAAACHWPGEFDSPWAAWDVDLVGDIWHSIRIRTATEELGWPRRFTRARCSTYLTWTSILVSCGLGAWTGMGVLTGAKGVVLLGILLSVALLITLALSRIRCLDQVTRLLLRAALRANLQPESRPKPPARHESVIDAPSDQVRVPKKILAGA